MKLEEVLLGVKNQLGIIWPLHDFMGSSLSIFPCYFSEVLDKADIFPRKGHLNKSEDRKTGGWWLAGTPRLADLN